MAIDASIPLQFHPTTALADPLEQTARAVQLRGAVQNQQQSAATNAQALQAGAQEMQQRQIQMDQNAAVNKAYQEAFTVDPATGKGSLDTDGLSKALAQGGHGAAIPGIIEAANKAQQGIATLAETRGKITDQQNDAAGGMGAAVRAANYDPRLAVTLFQHAIDTKAVDAGAVQPIIQHIQQLLASDPSGASAAPEVKAAMDHLIAQSPKQQAADSAAKTADARKQTQETGAAKDAREAEKDAREAPGQAAASDKLVADAAFVAKDPLGLKPEERARYNQADAAQKQTIANQAAERKTAEANLRVSQARLKVEQDRYGFDAAGGISPQATAIVQGKMDPQTTRAMLRSNPGLLKQIMAADPNFDEANIDNRFNTLKEFTSTSIGKAGGQALALNTLIHHADLYMQTAEALKNGSFVPGNAVYNAVASVFGAAPPTNAALVARFFAGETGKVATGGVPAEGEINGILKSLGASSSPEGIAGAGKTLLQIAAGRATPLMERAKQAKIDNQVQVLGPDAKEILSRRGFDPNTMKPAAAGGGRANPGGAVSDEVKALLGAKYVQPGVHTLSDGSKYMKATDGTITAQ